MGKQKYTKKKKDNALALLDGGMSFRDVSDVTGISRAYLERLKKNRDVMRQRADIVRDTLADQLYLRAQEAAGVLADGRLALSAPGTLVKVIEGSVKTARLMEDKPTDISAKLQVVIDLYGMPKIKRGPVIDITTSENPQEATQDAPGGDIPPQEVPQHAGS